MTSLTYTTIRKIISRNFNCHQFNFSSSLVSFLDPEKCKSHESKEYPSECFSFKIPADVDVSTVESASLWLYNQPGKWSAWNVMILFPSLAQKVCDNDFWSAINAVTFSSRLLINRTLCSSFTDSLDFGMKQTFLLSEIGHWGANLNFTKAKPIAIREVDQSDESWEKIDVAWPVKNWVEFHDLSHTIQVACETCSTKHLPISMHSDRKPFIVIDTFPQRTISRQARSANCGLGSTECCRDALYIDFATIGWDDWIIHPKGYNAYFCRGTCDRVASITNAGTHHSTVLNVS